MDPTLARKMWRTLEPYHGLIYFSPQADAAYRALGMAGQGAYFASRAAAMGAVPAAVVRATFFNFEPGRVERAVPAAWDIAPPSAWVEARLAAVDASLRDALGDEVLASAEVAAAATTARRAAAACALEGRPLFAGHASLDWPDEPHLVLWHAITLLREFRGDGHVALLVAEGFDGCEALVSHGAAGDVPPAVLQSTRGWSDEAWAAAEQRLEARGLLSGGQATDLGREVRDRIERGTDERSMAPWEAIGEAAADDLRAAVRPLSRAIVASGALARPPH